MLHIAFLSKHIYQNKNYGLNNYHSDFNYKVTYIYWLFCGHHCGHSGNSYRFHCCDGIHLKERQDIFLHITYNYRQSI